ncbi:MAG: NAD-dependent epimerase/dehydratase family protein [Rhizobiaceae bacterium]|nr:NAD-dependent epimerase/dehydratase family protein [Rhizobiaceae bacterium]
MIVVTGASGVLGTALVAALSSSGEEVVGLTSADGDLRDAAAATAVFERLRPSVVFHTAGRVHGIMGNQKYPAEMFLDNIRININVIDAARRLDCRKVVGISTVAAYPAGLRLPIGEDEIWNGMPHGSEEFYAHAKRAMLAQLQSCHRQYGMDYAYAIMTNLYGPNDRFDIENGHVIPSLVAKFHAASREKTAVNVWGTGVARRDFLHADDAARALLTIGKAHSGLFNIASGTTVPIGRVVEILSEVSGVADVEWDRTKPDGQLDRSYDVTRIAQLGFEVHHTLETGLAETYEWYASRYPDVRL